jgi:hypothetical protein
LNLNFIAGDFLHIKFNQLADGGKLIKKEWINKLSHFLIARICHCVPLSYAI